MIDSHAHIQFDVYDEDREEMLERAWRSGLEKIIVIGGEKARNLETLSMAEMNGRLAAVIGFHPLNAGDYSPEEERILRSQLSEKKPVAVGEIGLDYHNNVYPKELQFQVFSAQLSLAKEFDLPIVVHSRDALEDTIAILKDFPGLRGQIHCFSYDAAAAERFLEMGFHISFCGPITFKNGQLQRSASLVVPMERLLAETDCPYMAPEPYRGRRNEPSFVVEIAKAHARLRGVSYEELDAAVTENTKRLFML
ncbi:TatD family hydrolase [bacterium]|nr:TatD family hydrolase [bacterium]